MDDNGNLQISVTNFGPIERAEIDLRPLTVFVGPSNTGKSYLAMLVYGLHNFIRSHSAPLGVVSYRSVWEREFNPSKARNVSAEYIGALADWLERTYDQTEKTADTEDFRICVPDSIRPMIQLVMESISEDQDYMNRELSRCFGVLDTGTLIRYRSGGETNIRLRRRLNPTNRAEAIEYGFKVNQEGSALNVSIPTETPLYAEDLYGDMHEYLTGFTLPSARYITDSESEERRWLHTSHIVESIVELIESTILDPLYRNAYYLPADRTGVMHAHKVAVGSLIARAPYSGLQRDDPMPLLSGVLADFLGELTQMGGPQNPVTPFRQQRRERSKGARKLAARLENEIIGGAVNIHQSPTGYPSFYYRPDGWERELPLMNVSSMVSELAPVALYLRHVVSEGDTLIIEEPESHLHPALQVEFIRYLAAVVHSGVRVMLTTHSEWIMDELINLVRLSELEPDDRPEVGGAKYAIGPEQLGVWRFDSGEGGHGSVVKEIPFELEIANFRSGFSEVAEDTYNDYARISNWIEMKRGETQVMGLVDDVSARAPDACLTNRARGQGCSVNLSGAPSPYVLIDMDCRDLGISQNASRCDFLFFSDDGNWVVPMELKRGKIDSSDQMVRQLTAGARYAASVVPRGTEVSFRPVAVHGGGTRRTETEALRNAKIRFRGVSSNVELLRCGQAITAALRRR